MKKIPVNIGESLVPGLTLLFAIGYLVQIRDAPLVAVRWPYIVLGITAVLWLGILAFYLFKPTSGTIKVSRKQLEKPALMLFVPLGYLLLIPMLGFSISSLLFQTTLFRLLGSKSWKLNLVVALVMTLLLHITLLELMDMSLPRLEIGDFIL